MAQSLYTRALDHFISFLAVKDRIITCSKVNKPKDDPNFYLACASTLKQSPKDIVVFEDADYCIDVARKAGFKVVKIKDWRDLDAKCIDDCGK